MDFSLFETEFGCCAIIGKGGQLVKIIPFFEEKEGLYSLIYREYKGIAFCHGCFGEIQERIERYLSGEKVNFDFPVDFSRYTMFQRKTWEVTQSIPYGEIRTYKWVSQMIANSRSYRAVGSALRKNPFPLLVPCHRVIRSNGELGGYSAIGDINIKARLLKMEGHQFDSKRRVNIFF
ncbi:MAG: methylated-DNA--[protein]-cysteine S-methyltransferase [Thermodesulfobacteriota bacterium]|nr:methylated-DNA--[protein]-cysteine S-methyltransferase [Thermodesulfobacteriota bacterium]